MPTQNPFPQDTQIDSFSLCSTFFDSAALSALRTFLFENQPFQNPVFQNAQMDDYILHFFDRVQSSVSQDMQIDGSSQRTAYF